MDKFKPIDPAVLRQQCKNTIEEYREKHRASLAYRAFLVSASRRRTVDRRITSLMHDKLHEQGFAGHTYALYYHKDTDFMNRDRYKISVEWREPYKRTDNFSWYLGQSDEATEHSLLGFSLLTKHADFLQDRLVSLDVMVQRYNAALLEMQDVARLTVCGLHAVYPLCNAFHYYDLP